MRGHPYCLSCSLRIHSIFCAVRLCLLGLVVPLPVPLLVPSSVASFLRPAPRAVWSLLVPVFRLPLRLLASASCLLHPGSQSSWFSRIASRPVFPLSPPIAPPIVSNKRGDIALLAYRCHVRRSGPVRLLFLSCAWRLCLLGAWGRSRLLKCFPWQSFKNLPRKPFKNLPRQFFKHG